MSLKGTFVSDDSCIWHGENELFSRYHHTNVFQPLENTVNDLEVLPDEAANAWVVRDSLVRAIRVFISSGDRLDGYVIDKWIAVARYLVLKNKGHISLINLYRIGISHRDRCETMRTQGTIEGSEVP